MRKSYISTAPLSEKDIAPNMAAVLENTARNFPDKGIYYLDMKGKKTFQSYPALLEEARHLLGGLKTKGFSQGDLILFQIKDERKYIQLMWGAIMGGMIPVPLKVPEETAGGKNRWERLRNLLPQIDNPRIITENELLPLYDEIRSEFPEVELYTYEEVETCKEESESPEISPNDTLMIQFSSGSTSTPKGIRLTHRNLTYNITAMLRTQENTGEHKTLCWLTLTHNLGLVCFNFAPIVAGFDQYHISSQAFIQNPKLLFEIIGSEKISVIGLPNFLQKWMVEKIPGFLTPFINMRSIRVILNGSEPINPQVVRDFMKKFKLSGLRKDTMYCSFGMTETTVGATSRHPEDTIETFLFDRIENKGYRHDEIEPADNITEVIHVGTPIPGVTVKIVGENDAILPEGDVGELLVSGPNITPGYYKNDGLNSTLFLDGFLRTGDLGFIKEGRLVITGRKKDIIFINGQNFYSHDLEEIVEKITRISANRICVSPMQDRISGKDELVVFLEEPDNKGLMKKAESGLARDFMKFTGTGMKDIVWIEKIPRTNSGKKQRFKLMDNYLADAVSIMAEIPEKVCIPPRNENDRLLLSVWKEVLKMDSISIEDNFFALGGNSINVMECISALLKQGVRVNPGIFQEHPSISELSDYIKNAPPESLQPPPPVSGDVPILPNRYIYEKRQNDLHHWNFCELFELTPMPAFEMIQDVALALWQHHDGLRLKLEDSDFGWKQSISGEDSKPSVVKIDVSHLEEEFQSSAIENMVRGFQKNLDLGKKPFEVVVFYLADGKPGRLLLVMNHLLFDAYSLTIFMEDLIAAYGMKARGLDVMLPLKTDSIQEWARWVNDFAQSDSAKKDLSYWTNIPYSATPVPLDTPEGLAKNTSGSEKFVELDILTSSETEFLFDHGVKGKTQITHILLAALQDTYKKWTGSSSILVDYTFNGRFHPEANIDLSRTIGWIAFLVPLYFDFPDKINPLDMIEAIINQFEEIPNNGMSYGALRYLCEDEAVSRKMADIPQPEITFNYYDIPIPEYIHYESEENYIKFASEDVGPKEGENMMRGRILDLVVSHRPDRGLFCKWHYSPNVHAKSTATKLAEMYKKAVRVVFDAYKAKEKERVRVRG